MKRGKAKNLGTWWRTYVSILDSPKIIKLSDAAFRAWMNMMAIATIYGGLIPLDLEDVSIRLRKPIGKVREMVRALLAAKLMDETDGGYVMHDWEERQFSSDVSTGRVKQFRERQKAVSETPKETPMKSFTTVSETSPEAEADSEAEAKTRNQPPSLTAAREESPRMPLAAAAPDQSGCLAEEPGFERAEFDKMVVHLGAKAGVR